MSADEAVRRLSAALLEATLDGHYRVRADDLVAALGEIAGLRARVAELSERNTQLGLLRVDAESAVECARALCQGAAPLVPVSAVLAVLDGAQ